MNMYPKTAALKWLPFYICENYYHVALTHCLIKLDILSFKISRQLLFPLIKVDYLF